jgi:Domain of unknown function (DUF5916)/Carbohydrate family 9 binding domain-like
MLRMGLALLAALGSVARADDALPVVRAHAVRRAGPIVIDGQLDEQSWAAAPRQAGFIQRFPKDAARPSAETRFAILYDDDAIYVGVWADDPRPDQIRALLTRRDVDSSADAVMVAFDSYHDRRTAYAFQLNAAGVQRDLLLFDDSSQDDTWDAVWTGNVALTSTGWTAEYRIPLGQLRFVEHDAQEWGVQLVRLIGRTGEQDSWSPWPRSAPQVVSKFGVLDGIDHLIAARRLELLPYTITGIDRMPVTAGDPLNQKYSWRRNAGLDLKYGLGPAFTVSATINPDFGQVEADPSQVNLTANELFFAERRPFFLEAVDLFKLPLGDPATSVESAFYSRRIGAIPADPGTDYTFIKAPQSTTIYGAAKLTGKTAGGWSVGVLDAITGPETAETFTAPSATTPDAPGTRAEPAVAALTNYAIARIKGDFDEGKTAVGVSTTAVDRKLDDPALAAQVHDQAYTGGLQLQHRWADNVWTANVSLMGSWVHGTEAAIAETQQNSVHYLQRPDLEGGSRFDPTRTSLSGLGASWMVGALGDTRHWRFGFFGDLRTTGLELNDAGFQLNSNRTVPFFRAQYHDDEPGAHVLNWAFTSDVWAQATLDPRLTDYGLECGGNVQLANYWSLAAGCNIVRSRWNVDALRGGPALRVDPRVFSYFNLTTDTRERVWFSLAETDGHNWTSGELDVNVTLGATLQALSNLDLSIGPSLYVRNDPLQYVADAVDLASQHHIVLGRIRETDVSTTLRVNWTFSPHLALQAYAQPYIASGHYSELKDVDHPAADRYADRFHVLTGDEIQLVGGGYRVARDGAIWSFDRPDFNFLQLRSTLVMRWEYRPGSTVFAIWSHGRTNDTFQDGRFQLGRDVSNLASTASENIVMVKVNYWVGL